MELINLMLAILLVFAIGAAIVFRYLDRKAKHKH